MIVDEGDIRGTKDSLKKIKASGDKLQGWFWLSMAPKRHSPEEEGLLIVYLKGKDKSGSKVQKFAMKMQKMLGRTKAVRGEVICEGGKIIFKSDRAYSPFKKCMKSLAKNYQLTLLKTGLEA